MLGLPVKTPVYGTLVGLLNLSNPDFAEEILLRVTSDLQISLDNAKEKDVCIYSHL